MEADIIEIFESMRDVTTRRYFFDSGSISIENFFLSCELSEIFLGRCVSFIDIYDRQEGNHLVIKVCSQKYYFFSIPYVFIHFIHELIYSMLSQPARR